MRRAKRPQPVFLDADAIPVELRHALTGIAASLHLSPKTVSTYRARILQKLALGSNADLTRYVIVYAIFEHSGLQKGSAPRQAPVAKPVTNEPANGQSKTRRAIGRDAGRPQ